MFGSPEASLYVMISFCTTNSARKLQPVTRVFFLKPRISKGKFPYRLRLDDSMINSNPLHPSFASRQYRTSPGRSALVTDWLGRNRWITSRYVSTCTFGLFVGSKPIALRSDTLV